MLKIVDQFDQLINGIGISWHSAIREYWLEGISQKALA